MRFLFFLFLPLAVFAQGINLPAPYRALIERIVPPGVKVEVSFYGDTFKAVVKEPSPGGGYTRIDLTGDDFISFYYQLYTTLVGQKPPEVSIRVKVGGQKVPFNPFFQLWDRDNGVRILKFSHLKPGCRPPVVGIEGEGLGGAKIWTTFREVERKLFEGGFKYPAYYCY